MKPQLMKKGPNGTPGTKMAHKWDAPGEVPKSNKQMSIITLGSMLVALGQHVVDVFWVGFRVHF